MSLIRLVSFERLSSRIANPRLNLPGLRKIKFPSIEKNLKKTKIFRGWNFEQWRKMCLSNFAWKQKNRYEIFITKTIFNSTSKKAKKMTSKYILIFSVWLWLIDINCLSQKTKKSYKIWRKIRKKFHWMK